MSDSKSEEERLIPWTENDTYMLRQGGQYNGSPQNILANRAADEIERLRGTLQRIADGRAAVYGYQATAHEALRAPLDTSP